MFMYLAVLGLSCSTRNLPRLMWGLSLQCLGSRARGLSSCVVACDIEALRPGMEPASPALQDGCLTTGPPGKSPSQPVLILTQTS